MADTLTLDYLVGWCLDQGASVRLIGDDQQLGAIGAGGVLRDIATSHGALHLDHVLRFSDPAEAHASLALRSGDVGALGTLDHNRVHLVDPDTATGQLLAAWQTDRNTGLDAIMLAPTRTRSPNSTQQHGNPGSPATGAGRETALADGNQASCGDTVLTRRNDRTLIRRCRLGPQRRPVDRHPRPPRRLPGRPTSAEPQPAHPARQRLRPRVRRTRLCHHDPSAKASPPTPATGFKPARRSAARLHHAHPRTPRQPRLAPGRHHATRMWHPSPATSSRPRPRRDPRTHHRTR